MSSRRVTFSENNNVHEIPTDKLSINARLKFKARIKPTKYDPQNCEICKISCNSKKIFEMHVLGKKHKKALEKFMESMFRCDICSKTFNDLDSWYDHLNTLQHKKAEIENLSVTIGSVQNIVLNNVNYCDICKLNCGSNIILQSHLTGSKHKRKLKLLNIEKLKENKDSSVYCEICNISLEPELMILHKKSNKHKKTNVKENKLNSKPKNRMEFCAICNQDLSRIIEAVEHYKSTEHIENVKNKENIWCDVCKIILPESLMGVHLKGFRHYRILNREECSIEGSYKDKLKKKREKQKELRAQYEKEKLQMSEQNLSITDEVT